jgi:UDP-N-acetylmuramate-alanine ligase
MDFFKNICSGGTLIFNYDEKKALNTVLKSNKMLQDRKIGVYGFSSETTDRHLDDFIRILPYKIIKDKNSFIYDGVEYTMKHMMGSHNIFNTVAVLSLLKLLAPPTRWENGDVKSCIENAVLPKRRMEVVLDNHRIRLYDDYAHHHTQIFYNLSSLKNSKNPKEKVISVMEPHLISRFAQNPKEWLDHMEIADYSIITKFYKSRESFLPDLDMSKYLTSGRKTLYIENFDDVVKKIDEIINLPENDGIKFKVVIMGAGNSYKLTEKIKDIYAEK